MQQKTLAAVYVHLCFPPFLQGELADYIDATVRESQTKKTLELLKNKVHGLSVHMLALFPVHPHLGTTGNRNLYQRVILTFDPPSSWCTACTVCNTLYMVSVESSTPQLSISLT